MKLSTSFIVLLKSGILTALALGICSFITAKPLEYVVVTLVSWIPYIGGNFAGGIIEFVRYILPPFFTTFALLYYPMELRKMPASFISIDFIVLEIQVVISIIIGFELLYRHMNDPTVWNYAYISIIIGMLNTVLWFRSYRKEEEEAFKEILDFRAKGRKQLLK